jgi:hypothetical protein
MSRDLAQLPVLRCPQCGASVEPVTTVAFDLQLHAVEVIRARCGRCSWERTTTSGSRHA